MGRGMDALVAWFVCAVALRAQAAEQCGGEASSWAAALDPVRGGGEDWIDISITLQKGVPLFDSPDGLPRNWRTLSNDGKDGDECTVSWVHVDAHTGTVRLPPTRPLANTILVVPGAALAVSCLVLGWAGSSSVCSLGLDLHALHSPHPLPAARCLQHVDAPRHFLPDGPTIETLDLRHLVGPVEVVQVPPGSNITGGGQARSAGMREPAQSALGSEGCAGCASYLLLPPASCVAAAIVPWRGQRARCTRAACPARRFPPSPPPPAFPAPTPLPPGRPRCSRSRGHGSAQPAGRRGACDLQDGEHAAAAHVADRLCLRLHRCGQQRRRLDCEEHQVGRRCWRGGGGGGGGGGRG